jgi:D-alanyl-D-alanine carboxypeptidase
VSLAPLVQAQSALLYDLTHDQPILAHRASEPYSLASITKLMTALLVAEHYGGINDSASLVVSFEDLAVESPSKVLLTGDLLRVSEAIRILLVGSDNSAANLLARSVASTTNEFVRQMNVRAYSLGMTQTKFTDPIGFAGNLSTTMDLVVLTEYLLGHYPDLLRLTTYPSLTLILESGKSMAIQNTNILADKIPGVIGGKTGFLEETGGSLVTVFKIRGTVLATVVLGSPDRFGDTTQLIQWYLKNDLPPTTNNN